MFVQFRFDHRYVSDIDQAVRDTEKHAKPMIASNDKVPLTPKAMQLVPEDALPFSLKQQDTASASSD